MRLHKSKADAWILQDLQNALFDVRATDSNHNIFHTADKTDTRRHSLTGRKHHAQCLLTKPYYVHSTKPIRLRMERTVSQTLRQTRGEGNTKRYKKKTERWKIGKNYYFHNFCIVCMFCNFCMFWSFRIFCKFVFRSLLTSIVCNCRLKFINFDGFFSEFQQI